MSAAETPELTDCERAALAAVAIGITQKAAARRMKTTPNTLRSHIAAAAAKLGGVDTIHTIALAAAAGQLDAEMLRNRTLPRWPVDRQKELKAACAAGRAAYSASAADRREQYAELRRGGYTIDQAARRLGVTRRHADRYEAWRREQQATLHEMSRCVTPDPDDAASVPDEQGAA